jgi:hypothetical protein
MYSVWGAKEERRSSQLLSGANRVKYAGFAHKGFYCRIDPENMDSMIKTYNLDNMTK